MIRKDITKKPDINAAKAPARYNGRTVLGVLAKAGISFTVAPRIAGIERRKENVATSLRFKPTSKPKVIVEPLREIPGLRAKACPSPIIAALETFNLWAGIRFLVMESLTKFITPETTRKIHTIYRFNVF